MTIIFKKISVGLLIHKLPMVYILRLIKPKG